MESFILFYEKCRLCLEQPGIYNMFEKDETPLDIFSCTGVKVHPTDNLPQKICEICSKVITSAKELRLMAKKNNEYLRTLFDGEDDDSRLQIDEGVSSSECRSDFFNDEEKSNSSPNNKNSTSNNKPSSSKIQIAVRTDLFETSTTVTSSTKNNADTPESPRKKIKLEDSSLRHECPTCQKTFDTSKKLYLHVRMHNKAVVCPLDACGKRFATKGDLEKHIRTHTGEKPYSCHICGKGFAQRGTLKAHRETLHGKQR